MRKNLEIPLVEVGGGESRKIELKSVLPFSDIAVVKRKQFKAESPFGSLCLKEIILC